MTKNNPLEIELAKSYYAEPPAGGLVILFYVKEIGQTVLTSGIYHYLVLQSKAEAQPSVAENFFAYQVQLVELARLAEEQINNTSGFISQIIDDLR